MKNGKPVNIDEERARREEAEKKQILKNIEILKGKRYETQRQH